MFQSMMMQSAMPTDKSVSLLKPQSQPPRAQQSAASNLASVEAVQILQAQLKQAQSEIQHLNEENNRKFEKCNQYRAKYEEYKKRIS